MDFTFTLSSLNVTQQDILKIVNDPQGPVVLRLKRVGKTIVAAAKAQVGVDSGELQRSIHYNLQRYGGLPEVWIGSYNSIAYLHHEGTRPHAISARNAQFLRYSSRGRIVYARTVWHPGTKPNRFLTDNIYLARI